MNIDASPTERAWAAGLFDAEGCTRFKVERSGQRRLSASLPQSGHGRVAEVLTRFKAAVGCGAIYGPWPNGSHVWELRGPSAIQVLTLMWPWLGRVKREQLCSALTAYNDALHTPRARDLTFVEPLVRVEDLARFGPAWAAGLFDGDGSTSNSIRHLKGGVVSCGVKASVSQSGPTGVPEVLERFRSVVGLGQIYGPIRWRNANEPGFEWTIQAYRDVRQLREVLDRLIGPAKAAQMDQALRAFERSPHRRKSALRPL